MKYALVIPDGAADEPQESLDGRTPLEAASLPRMDQIVRQGVIGAACHVPETLPPGSDVGSMSLLGYDPREHHTGRAPLEAVARGVPLGQHDWAIRCNLVTVTDGRMASYTAGQIPGEIASGLLSSLQEDVAGNKDGFWQYLTGVSYRNLLIYRSLDARSPFSPDTSSTPPHDITNLPISNHLPAGPGAEVLATLMDRSVPVLAHDADNRARGAAAATQVWLWGLGQRPGLANFNDRFGVRGAMIAAVDLLRGIGRLLGWTVIEVDGATGNLETDYAAKGRSAIEALSDHDLVVVHVEAPDEATHEGDTWQKIEALERIDEAIVGPLHRFLESQGDYRLLVSPDHPTLLRTRTHSHGLVPIAACGSGISADAAVTYDEITASGSPLKFSRGEELMPWFLDRDAVTTPAAITPRATGLPVPRSTG